MAIGPVQLLVLGFKQPDFHGEIREEVGAATSGRRVGWRTARRVARRAY